MLPLANILYTLLGLDPDQVSIFAGDTHLGWTHPLPAWGWALVVLAALGVGLASYVRLSGGTASRCAMAVLRAMLVMLVALLLSGPQFVKTERTRLQDALVVLVDRSLSMNFADMGDASKPQTREAALHAALAANPGLFGPEQLEKDRKVFVLGFDAAAWSLADLKQMPEPAGRQTSLRTAIEQGVASAGGRRIAGVVLMTDGQSPQPISDGFMSALAHQDIPIFPVPIGAPTPPPDISVVNLQVPPAAFIADLVPVTVGVDELGLPSGQLSIDPSKVRIELRDKLTGTVLDTTTLDKAQKGQVHLKMKSDVAGTHAYTIAAAADGVRELNSADNSRDFEVTFLDRPLRVLYIEGYPRWEYRYLKNTLLREGEKAVGSNKTLIESSMWLCEADRSFVQEGTRPIQRLPQKREEFAEYDVIILGDIPADYLTAEQRRLIREHVSLRGGGLLFVGGERWLPSGYAKSELAELLPMRQPDAVNRISAGSLSMRPTVRAAEFSLLELNPRGAAEGTWPKNLPPLYYAQQLGTLKPTADVLAETVTNDGQVNPVLTRMPYGAGEVFYLGCDETWRWRRLAGEAYHDPFWIQLLRKLGRTRVERSGRNALLAADPQKIVLKQSTRLRLELLDSQLIAGVGETISATAVPMQGGGASVPLVLQAESVGSTGADEAAAAGVKVFVASFCPDATGRYLISVQDTRLPEGVRSTLQIPVDVVGSNDELSMTATDFPRLERLAQATHGEVVPLAGLGKLKDLVQDRSQEKTKELPFPLWHAPLLLALLVLIPTLEWIIRRMNQLV